MFTGEQTLSVTYKKSCNHSCHLNSTGCISKVYERPRGDLFKLVGYFSFSQAVSQCYFTLQTECSFVSLRDVERAMVVFEYFYEKMGTVFTQLINEGAKKDHYKLDAVDSNEVNHYCSYVHNVFSVCKLLYSIFLLRTTVFQSW